jgi:magnesium-transporting ATPase (P-type)
MYIGVEMIRLFQSPLIKNDNDMSDKKTNKPALARTSGLADELGQVEYILSDKTGTLTKNSMILEKISIDDKIYKMAEIEQMFMKNNTIESELANNRNNEIDRNLLVNNLNNNDTNDILNKKIIISEFTSELCTSLTNKEGSQSNNKQISIDDEIIGSSYNIDSSKNINKIDNIDNDKDENNNLNLDSISKNEEKIIDFFRLINICNSIVIDYSKSKDNEIVYQVKFFIIYNYIYLIINVVY